MNRNSVILAALLLLFPYSAVAGYVGVGDKAPAFQATTIEGQKVSLDNPQSEKPLFLVFWATWCPYCEASIPRLKEIYSKYSPKDMTFLAINPGVNDSLRKTQLYTEKYHIPYPVVYDEGGAISKSFGINGVPTIIIVDKDDIVRHRDGIPDNIDEAIKSGTPEMRAARLTP
ncbi:MAG: TlpA family protein disulfide reductase [Desulfomonilaceae bacterium]